MTKAIEITVDFTEEELKFLALLSEKFPTVQAASTEIINLKAILRLPKGTEHFLTDIHGEFETFNHILRNASGMVRRKIDEVYRHELSDKEKRRLSTLIYYPKQKLRLIKKEETNLRDWYTITLHRIIKVAQVSADKYTRSKVRKAMPDDYAYIIDELLTKHSSKKEKYFHSIISAIIDLDRADHFIHALSNFIKRLLIDKLHIIGDIYDRGPYADKVMDLLMDHHSVDIQWGNHDIIWMSAASGHTASIAAVTRLTARYNNLSTLDSYGINLLPLATLALDLYEDDPCVQFIPKSDNNDLKSKTEISLVAKMHKTITIIEWKLQGAIIKKNPEFEMDDRLMFDLIDWSNNTIKLDGVDHPLLDNNFPTVDPDDPYRLTEYEQDVIEKLRFSFISSDRLQKHIKVLFANGSTYLKHNNNLLFHGCIPMNPDGSLMGMKIYGKEYFGKDLLDQFDIVARRAYQNRLYKEYSQQDGDYTWYMWLGAKSSLFGKSRMTTFERYMVADKSTMHETKNSYYDLRDSRDTVKMILSEFGLDPEGNTHIINGHVPVKVSEGESPVKAGGKLFVIDGGMSHPYRKVTGITGYTLIFDSYSLILVEHLAFESRQEAIESEADIISTRSMVDHATYRISVGDTDDGSKIKQSIGDLHRLLEAYQLGLIKVKSQI